ncbi:methyltransferase domain-containing protein [Streptomyces sp. URMC 127]|uniref:methyltransferase domain-containing protein n=1 Tax=Streptomyces sp. URMC 127 TaxID=3423402 RepID=UPI003F1BB93C
MESPWDTIASLTERLDQHSTHQGEMRRVLQILKISEEAGEAAEAVIGAMGQNPRKGFSHTWDDVQAEVCDVITTAMVALERLTPDAPAVFARHLARIAERDLGVKPAPVETLAPSPFTGTAPFYRRYRPGLPPQAAALLARQVADVEEPTLLDLGSGTGQVPLALHKVFARVDMVEPDPGMVAEAKRLQPYLEGPGQTVRLHNVMAEDFTPPSETWHADLVTICRAFHWVSQDTVLRQLETWTTPQATVAVMGDKSLWTLDHSWTKALRMLIQSFLGDNRHAGPGGIFNPHSRPYADVLAESAFSDVQEYQFEEQREWTPYQVIGYLSSTSFASRAVFGDKWPAFERQALRLLIEHCDQGTGLLTEENTFSVLLAYRP